MTTVGAHNTGAREHRARTVAIVSTCAAIALGAGLALTLASPRHSEEAQQLNPSSGAPVTLVSLRRIGQGGELGISGLPQPPIGEVYELWLARSGRPPQPTDALFTVSNAGGAAVAIPGSLRGLEAVLVTAEPIGGSSRPTSPPILRVALAG
jgi:Anti-sigma-K factor rskA